MELCSNSPAKVSTEASRNSETADRIYTCRVLTETLRLSTATKKTGGNLMMKSPPVWSLCANALVCERLLHEHLASVDDINACGQIARVGYSLTLEREDTLTCRSYGLCKDRLNTINEVSSEGK